jgi:hypothetical protein
MASPRKGPAAVAGDAFEIAGFECIARSNDRAKHDLNTERSQVSIVMIIAVLDDVFGPVSCIGVVDSNMDPVDPRPFVAPASPTS